MLAVAPRALFQYSNQAQSKRSHQNILSVSFVKLTQTLSENF